MAIPSVKKRTVPQRHGALEVMHNQGIHIDSKEIFVNSESYDDESLESGIDFSVANVFIKNLRYLEAFDSEPITVHFCCTGGEWPYGMAIYDAIAHSTCHILSISHGWAVSMSSIMMQAADTRLLMPNCSFMIHHGSAGMVGTSKQFLTEAEQLKKTCDVMLDNYVRVCVGGEYFKERNMGEKAVKTFLQKKMDLKEEWWLTAKEAVYYGFADGVIGDEGYETTAKAREKVLSV